MASLARKELSEENKLNWAYDKARVHIIGF